MKKLILVTGLLALTNAHAQIFPYTERFGIGGSWGLNAPVFGNTFNSDAGADQTWDIHARIHLNASSGLEAAFTKHEFAEVTTAAQVSDLTYFRRLYATQIFSPLLGVGAGVVDLTHYESSSLQLGLKLRGGFEYTLVNHANLGFNIDYQYASSNIHILAMRVGLTWYIGSDLSDGVMYNCPGTGCANQ
jgi:hypothetical protein